MSPTSLFICFTLSGQVTS
uniref:Uncharacterized protein n=1 Tax=Anguilla anguilla TaxID=7936 RepID=A0A0E9TL92_ANGAN